MVAPQPGLTRMRIGVMHIVGDVFHFHKTLMELPVESINIE